MSLGPILNPLYYREGEVRPSKAIRPGWTAKDPEQLIPLKLKKGATLHTYTQIADELEKHLRHGADSLAVKYLRQKATTEKLRHGG